jgi:hypothetical protein
MKNAEKYNYIIDLDERGCFNAHVENEKTGKVIFSFSNEEENEEGENFNGSLWIVEDGFMKHTKDIDGLQEYLIDVDIMNENDILKFIG